jgi:signal peptidase II
MSLTVCLAAAVVLALDQATKRLVRTRLAEGQAVPLGPFRIRRLTNARRRGGWWWLAAVVIVSLVLVEIGSPLFRGLAARIGLGLALGGALGNVVDTRRGGVLDFVDLRVWPVFNVADAGIVLGAGMVLWNVG